MTSLLEMGISTYPLLQTDQYLIGDIDDLTTIIAETVEHPSIHALGIAETISETSLHKIFASGIVDESCRMMGITENKLPLITPLQAGHFANHILFNYTPMYTVRSKKISLMPEHIIEKGFVLCVAKYSSDTEDGNRIRADYDNLVNLYKQFPQGSRYKGCTYRTVAPLTTRSIVLTGKQHDIYTTVYDPNPELNCDGKIVTPHGYSQKPTVLPFLFHPTPHNKWEHDSNGKIRKEISKMIKRRLFTPHETQRLRNAFEQILMGNALIAASSERFPIDFSINRGDWVGNFHATVNSLEELTFISTNGVTHEIYETMWVDQMKQYEVMFPMYDDFVAPNCPMIRSLPFSNELFGFSDQELQNIYQQATKLMDTSWRG